jgi:hypothetical protein
VLYNDQSKFKTLEIFNTGRAMNDIDTNMMSNIIEIQDIWNLLYRQISYFGSDGYGKGFRPYTTNNA